VANLDLTRVMNNIRTRLPGALDSAIQLELFNTLQEFFDQSNIWQEAIDFRTRSGMTTYSIEPESVSTILRLISLENASQTPVQATMEVVGDIVLGTEPSSTETLTATVSLTVNDPVNRENYPEFPTWILDKYWLGFVDGVLGRMMSQPAKPWSSERLAIYHMRNFRGVVASAKMQALHKNLNNGQTWRFPAFA
jgi:hypothetical protein